MEYNITYRQKDKGWQYIISSKENGKWRQVKSKQGFKTKKDSKLIAEEMLKLLKKEEKNEKNVINSNYNSITFSELSNSFIEHNLIYKEPNTIEGYRNSHSKFKNLDDLKVKDIKKINIQKCIDTMVTENLKVSTIKTNLRRIKLFFKYYIENYDLNYQNPVFKITLPKEKNKTIKKALTKTEMYDLFKTIKNNKFYIVAYIAGTCGLRCGEILGLTLDDIDEVNMKISVIKQWKKLKDGTIGFGALKTGNAPRKVPITKTILNEIKDYLSSHPIQIDKRIAPFNEDSITKYLNADLRKIAGISLHELRHTYATLLIGNDIDFKTVANFLGHDVKQTISTYSHVTDDMIKKAANKIAKIF